MSLFSTQTVIPERHSQYQPINLFICQWERTQTEGGYTGFDGNLPFCLVNQNERHKLER